MAHAASGDKQTTNDNMTPISRPRRSQIKNSRFADFEVEHVERKVRTPSQAVSTDSVKGKRGRPKKSETPLAAVKENESDQPVRTLTKRGLKNSSLSKYEKTVSKKDSPRSVEESDDSKQLLQEQGNTEKTPAKRKRGRPPGSKNKPKPKARKISTLPFSLNKEQVSDADSDDSEDEWPMQDEPPLSKEKQEELLKKKLRKYEQGKLKLMKLKNLAAQRFGEDGQIIDKTEDDENESDEASLSSFSDSEASVDGVDPFLDNGDDSDSSCVDSDAENISDDSMDGSVKGKKESPRSKENKLSKSYLVGKKKLEEMKRKMAAMAKKGEEGDENENPEDMETSTSNLHSGVDTEESLDMIQKNSDSQSAAEDEVSDAIGGDDDSPKKSKKIWESDEYYKGKEKLVKMQQLASRKFGVKPQKKQPPLRKQFKRFKSKPIKKFTHASGQTHVTSDEYGEIDQVGSEENPVTTYKLGEKYKYTVTYSEENPDVLTFTLEPPPPPQPEKTNRLSSLSEDLLKMSKTQQLHSVGVPKQETEESENEVAWTTERLIEQIDGQNRISILPTNFTTTDSGSISAQSINLQSGEASEQAQTIVVSGSGQEHILTEGDVQNAYTVEIQHPDGTTQEHVSFDPGLTFVVNDMQEGTGTQNALPVSLSDLADLASLQVQSSDGQITHSLALPGLTFAQQDMSESDGGNLTAQIDSSALKGLVTDPSNPDQPIVFIVKQEDQGSPSTSTGFTQWSICGDPTTGEQKITKASASSNLLSTAAELSRIQSQRKTNVTQEYLQGEVNLERLKQMATVTTFQETAGNEES